MVVWEEDGGGREGTEEGHRSAGKRRGRRKEGERLQRNGISQCFQAAVDNNVCVCIYIYV